MSQKTNLIKLISQIHTADDFTSFVEQVENQQNYKRPEAFAIGIATIEDNSIIEVLYPCINVNSNYGTAAILSVLVGHISNSASYMLDINNINMTLTGFSPFINDDTPHPNIEILKKVQSARLNNQEKRIIVTYINDLDSPPISTEDAYLRLQILSHRLVKPNDINLTGLFGLLPNIAWTNEGPMSPERANNTITKRRLSGTYLQVFSVDKFPRMTDYIVPSGVRIAVAIRVRLGAYVGEGVTFMHEGFCNFNAGAEGPNMIEGRISQGVFIEKDSDLGGGSATMGTLSGGGKELIRVGIVCLLGSNSVLGIPLGDFCTVEAGLALTAGAKVLVYAKNDPKGTQSSPKVTKARVLSGQSGILFRRSSTEGCIEALYQKNEVELNEILHSKQ